jgi:hypothetical protein
MTRYMVVVVSVLMFACGSWAQTTPPPDHHHAAMVSSAVVIDGRIHPELISDLTAYRLFFLVYAENADTLARNGGATHHQVRRFSVDLRFTPAETESTASILADFRQNYDAFLKDNHERTKNGQNDATAVQRRDAIVQDTIDKLRNQLSPTTMTVLHQHILSRKMLMQHITTKEGQ